MDLTFDQFAGCMLGLATGDALGAPHEGGIIEKLLCRGYGPGTARILKRIRRGEPTDEAIVGIRSAA
jgi:ADP-ribosylglycohydrolase